MDILGQDNRKPAIKHKGWNNAATDDLAAIDKEISAVTTALNKARATNREATTNINKCEAEKKGLFSTYNCKKNTGKTLNDWEDIANSSSATISSLTSQLSNLNKDRAAAVTRVKQEAMAAGETADAAEKIAQKASAESKASAEKAKSVGLWVGLGLGVVAIGAIIWMKIIKKK